MILPTRLLTISVSVCHEQLQKPCGKVWLRSMPTATSGNVPKGFIARHGWRGVRNFQPSFRLRFAFRLGCLTTLPQGLRKMTPDTQGAQKQVICVTCAAFVLQSPFVLKGVVAVRFQLTPTRPGV